LLIIFIAGDTSNFDGHTLKDSLYVAQRGGMKADIEHAERALKAHLDSGKGSPPFSAAVSDSCIPHQFIPPWKPLRPREGKLSSASQLEEMDR